MVTCSLVALWCGFGSLVFACCLCLYVWGVLIAV